MKCKDDFEQLFGNLAIGKNPTVRYAESLTDDLGFANGLL